MIKRLLTTSFVLALLLVNSSSRVHAAVTCTTQYGGGQTCVSTGQLLVNKTVWNPDTKAFVDNLTLTDHRFQVGDEVMFHIDVKNVGDATLATVNFTDTLPGFLVWSGGDTLSLTISNLTPGQMVTKEIRAKVLATNAVVCNVNTVVVSSPQDGSDQDMAQLCVGSNVLGVTNIPKTGPEMGVLALLPGLGVIGMYLRKFDGLKGVKHV